MKQKFTLLILALFISLTLFSQSGKYIEFDGVNQYMKILNHTDFNITTSESFTVSMWINVLEFKNNNARFLDKRCQNTTATDKSGYELFGANSSAQYYATNTPNTAGNHTNSLSAWSAYSGSVNKWVHIAIVVDRAAGVMTEYIDGVGVVNSSPKDISPWTVNNTYDVYVGCGIIESGGAISQSNFFHGQIDNIRIWKKALTAAEIQADMTGTVTASTPGLVAGYDFETITDNIVSDITGKHPATLFNFPVNTVGDLKISSAAVTQETSFTGRGNKNEQILKVALSTTGSTPVNINNMVINMNGTTNIADIDSIKIYNSKSIGTFDPRKPFRNIDCKNSSCRWRNYSSRNRTAISRNQ